MAVWKVAVLCVCLSCVRWLPSAIRSAIDGPLVNVSSGDMAAPAFPAEPASLALLASGAGESRNDTAGAGDNGREQATSTDTDASGRLFHSAPTHAATGAGGGEVKGRELFLMLANKGSGVGMGADVVEEAQKLKLQTEFEHLEAHLVQLGAVETNMSSPAFVIERFRDDKKPRPTELVRVVIVGGDGTVSALVPHLRNAFDKPEAQVRWAIATLPLGTGNDFSRTIGYGGTFTCEKDSFFWQALGWSCTQAIQYGLQVVSKAALHQVDQWRFVLVPHAKWDDEEAQRWKVPGASVRAFSFEELLKDIGSNEIALYTEEVDAGLFKDTTSFMTGTWLNYLTWGMDAKIAADVDDYRANNPGQSLKPEYVKAAAAADWALRWQKAVPGALNDKLRVKIQDQKHGKTYPWRPRPDRGVDLTSQFTAGFFNIPSYSGGVNPFKLGRDMSIPGDGEFEFGSHEGGVLTDGAIMQLGFGNGFHMHRHLTGCRVDFHADFVKDYVNAEFLQGLPIQHDGERWQLLTSGATLFVVRNTIDGKEASVPVLVPRRSEFITEAQSVPRIFELDRSALQFVYSSN